MRDREQSRDLKIEEMLAYQKKYWKFSFFAVLSLSAFLLITYRSDLKSQLMADSYEDSIDIRRDEFIGDDEDPDIILTSK